MGKTKKRSVADEEPSDSMDLLQQSLMDIENEIGSKKQRTSKVKDIPEVFHGLEYHSVGKKGQSNAVVQALTSVILDRGGDTIPASYFGLLLTSLPNTNDNEELDVMLYLLRLLLPEISASILTSKFNDIAGTFQSVLNSKYESALIVVNTLKCIELVMGRVAPVITTKPWKKQAKLVTLFHGLLALSIDPRAKVRKEAQQVVRTMYVHEFGKATGTNSGKIAGKFVISQLVSDKSGEEKKKTVSYIFTLFTAIGIYLPLHILTSVLDAVLSQMKQNPNFIRTQGYVLFSSIFAQRPTPLNQDIISKLLPQVEGLGPQEKDKLSVQYYSDAVANGMILLHEINPILAATKLSSCIQNLMTLVLSAKYESYESVFSAIESMLDKMVNEAMLRNGMNNSNSNLHQISEALRQGLSFQYQPAWGFVIALFVSYFGKMNRSSLDWMRASILSLEEFAKDTTAKYHSIASQALGTAIRVLGPAQFLSVLPLRFDLPLEAKERREWLLPILQRAVTGSTLAYFGEHFLPLLSSLKQHIIEAENADKSATAKHCRVLYNQVWELLPSFCTFPLDVTENFKNIAKTIGTLLNDEPDLRIILCKSLTTLITRNRSLLQSTEEFYLEDNQHDEADEDSFVSSDRGSIQITHELISPEQAAENLAEIGKFAKNFFPILFNIFCSLEQHTKSMSLRSAIYNAIKAFASASDKVVLESFFNSVLKKILECQGNTKADRRRKALLTELSQAFVDSVTIKQLEFLFKIIQPQLADNDIKIQKKSYQVLERLCCRREYLLAHLEELKQVLISSLSAAKAAAKKNRLRCLRYVVHALPGDPVEQLFNTNASIPSSEVLAEIIVCVKELNKAAREEAFQLLIVLCERSGAYHDDPSHFMQLVVAGLAGTSSHMISATVQALTRLVHHMRNELQPEFTESLYQTILILFTTKNREIVKSCLGFIKTCCTILTDEKFKANLKQTIDHIFLWINESKNRFRLKIKLILQKFITRAGYEEMQYLVPEEHHKLLASVRRDMIRNKEKAKGKKGQKDDNEDVEMSDSDDDEDMDSDDEFIEQFRVEPGEEREDDEVVDLLDPNASKRKNKKGKKIIKEEEILFKNDKQGRLLIEEEKSEKEERVPKSIHQMVQEKGGSLAPTRGKRSRLVDIDDDDEVESNGAAPPRKRQRTEKSENKYSGKEYKSKKSQGDVQVSGRYEPFAYMPMNPQLLNKRKQQKVKKQYRSVIASAQKGATKGRKARRK